MNRYDTPGSSSNDSFSCVQDRRMTRTKSSVLSKSTSTSPRTPRRGGIKNDIDQKAPDQYLLLSKSPVLRRCGEFSDHSPQCQILIGQMRTMIRRWNSQTVTVVVYPANPTPWQYFEASQLEGPDLAAATSWNLCGVHVRMSTVGNHRDTTMWLRYSYRHIVDHFIRRAPGRSAFWVIDFR